MTQREKLINLIYNTQHMTDLSEIVDHLLANGVIVPSVRPGDEVWYILYKEIESAAVYHVQGCVSRMGFAITTAYARNTDGTEVCFDEKSLGKGVFLTREEAEAALKERERG